MTVKEKVRVGGELEELRRLKVVILLGNSFPQTEFLIGWFSSICHQRLHFPIAGKERWSTLLKMKFLIFSSCAATPCI